MLCIKFEALKPGVIALIGRIFDQGPWRTVSGPTNEETQRNSDALLQQRVGTHAWQDFTYDSSTRAFGPHTGPCILRQVLGHDQHAASLLSGPMLAAASHMLASAKSREGHTLRLNPKKVLRESAESSTCWSISSHRSGRNRCGSV